MVRTEQISVYIALYVVPFTKTIPQNQKQRQNWTYYFVILDAVTHWFYYRRGIKTFIAGAADLKAIIESKKTQNKTGDKNGRE